MDNWVGATVKCPYYIDAIQTKRFAGIECESVPVNLGFDTRYCLRLPNSKELSSYVEIFCADMWETCPYASYLIQTQK